MRNVGLGLVSSARSHHLWRRLVWVCIALCLVGTKATNENGSGVVMFKGKDVTIPRVVYRIEQLDWFLMPLIKERGTLIFK